MLFRSPIRSEKSEIAIDMLDASAMLWRLHLAGHDVGDRWTELAKTWDLHADGRLYSFNDWHGVMAYLGAGRNQDVDRIIAVYRDTDPAVSENAAWSVNIGLPLVEGFAAFWRGDYQAAVEKLHAGRFIANGFGGSHAQRDVIDWTLTEAALRGGLNDVAEALANERLALKPHSPVNRKFLERAKAGSAGTEKAA